jgi:hypothetical protein
MADTYGFTYFLNPPLFLRSNAVSFYRQSLTFRSNLTHTVTIVNTLTLPYLICLIIKINFLLVEAVLLVTNDFYII